MKAIKKQITLEAKPITYIEIMNNYWYEKDGVSLSDVEYDMIIEELDNDNENGLF